jgi:hypothetical protein
MDFLANSWVIFLIVAACCWFIAVVQQLLNMSNMGCMLTAMLDGRSTGFVTRLLPVIFFGVCGAVTFALFLIGVVASFVN